jgi:two-component system C4-dicarboxylate transport response regulator DctD
VSDRGSVLFVDDELHVRLAGQQALELEGYRCVACTSAEEAMSHLSADWPGVVVTDIRMPGIDGLELLARCRALDTDLPVLLVTGHGDVAMAVQALKDGAYDFLEKPYRTDRLLDSVDRAMEKRRLVLENRALREELSRQGAESPLFGSAPVMSRLKQVLTNLADTSADVLIEGETGVGKDLVARTLHRLSERRDKPFVALNCGALPETLIESELFGHESGSFTGANRRRVGKFEHADGGTLFLDEIETMPASASVRLLRVLQERAVERLGSNKLIPIDIRVVAATKADLGELSERGEFRADLYYRLNVVKLEIPPLRERREDIPLLFQHFLRIAAQRHSRSIPELDPRLVSTLMARDWPGNVRELRNAAERLVLGYADDLTADTDAANSDLSPNLSSQVSAFEKNMIAQELRRQGGNVTATCRALGIPRKTLYDKLAKHGLKRNEFAPSPDG